jgi:signal transduction histidine kinase
VQDEKWRLLGQAVFPSLAPTIFNRSEPGAVPQVVDITFTDPEKEFRVLTAPISDEGKPFGFLKIVKDRTPELALVKSKTDFLEVASHQLRSPITSISWALEALLKDPALAGENKTFAEGALDASKALLQVANDLLSVSQSEGAGNYNFQEVDLVPFIERSIAPLLPTAKHAEVNVYLDPPKEALPKVFIDQEKITMALMNMLDNGIRYNVKNGEVTVSVQKDPTKPFLIVTVKDTGIGIPSDELAKITNKFYRADNAKRYQANGSGLGLFIVKNIVETHGGKLNIISEQNRGTEISFSLPTDPQYIPSYKANA